MNIHHVGYLIENMGEAVLQLEFLGYVMMGNSTVDTTRQAYISFMKNNGYVVELIQPISELSPIYGLRKKYKNSPYHICYITQDLNAEIFRLCNENSGNVLFESPTPAPAIGLKAQVAFIMSTKLGMIELVNMGE